MWPCLAKIKTAVGLRRPLPLTCSTCRLPPVVAPACRPAWLYGWLYSHLLIRRFPRPHRSRSATSASPWSLRSRQLDRSELVRLRSPRWLPCLAPKPDPLIRSLGEAVQNGPSPASVAGLAPVDVSVRTSWSEAVAVSGCCQSLRSVPARAAVHEAGVGVHSPIQPLYEEEVVFAPDRFAGMHEDRLIQYKVAPAINQSEAIGLFAQRCPSSWPCSSSTASARRQTSCTRWPGGSWKNSWPGSQRPTNYEIKLPAPATWAPAVLSAETPLDISHCSPAVRRPLAD